MTDREMIERRVQDEGYSIKEWKQTEDGDTAVIGRFAVVSADYEDEGIYEGDKGELTACVVGSEKFHNRRVCFAHTPDGTDGANEVRDLFILDPV